jgi:hypothetical protein
MSHKDGRWSATIEIVAAVVAGVSAGVALAMIIYQIMGPW